MHCVDKLVVYFGNFSGHMNMHVDRFDCVHISFGVSLKKLKLSILLECCLK